MASFSGPGEWNRELYVEHTDSFHAPGQPSWARATQVSDAVPGELGRVSAAGQVGGFDGFPVGGVGQGLGEMSFTAVLVLDAPSPADFVLSGTVGGPAAWFNALLWYSPPGGPQDAVFVRDLSMGPAAFEWHGVLPAGRYTFSASWRSGGAGAGTTGGSGHYDFTLAIPAPGVAAFILAALAPARRARYQPA